MQTRGTFTLTNTGPRPGPRCAARLSRLTRSSTTCSGRHQRASAWATALPVRPTTSTSDCAMTCSSSARSSCPMCGRCFSMKRRLAPSKLRQVHLGVVDGQLHALADELLGQRDQRAFAQVVGAGLERQADEADAALAGGQHLVAAPASRCCLVRRQDAAQHRHARRRASWPGSWWRAGPSAGTSRRRRSRASDRPCEMLSCVSWHTRSITSKGSTPSASHRRAVSLAKVIFSAWKLLQQYFIISAARTEVLR